LGGDRHPTIAKNCHAAQLLKDQMRWIFQLEKREARKGDSLTEYLSVCAQLGPAKWPHCGSGRTL
jgi:hypothetical protein